MGTTFDELGGKTNSELVALVLADARRRGILDELVYGGREEMVSLWPRDALLSYIVDETDLVDSAGRARS